MKFLLYIGNKLSSKGFSPGVIETLGSLLESEGYRIYYAGTYKNKILRLAEILLKTITTGGNTDYILIDTYSTSAFWYAYFSGRIAGLMGKKYLPILHGGDLPARLKKSPVACKRLFGNSYANVAVSSYLRHEFEKAGFKTVLIPNIIDLNLYPFKLRENPRPKLIWVRAFHKIYNPCMAADVLVLLLKSYPDAELCMVGPDKDGSMQEFKSYAEKLGVADRIRITGLLPKNEWVRLSENYDIFMNTTNYDNTPISVIEAMALGMCIVSTDPGGIPYLLEDGKDALIVKPGDSYAMAEKIIQLTGNPEIAKSISVNARKKAEKFDWLAIKQKWVDLLNA